MSKVSKESAKEQISMEGLEVGLEHLESGFTVCFESHSADVDLEPLFRGLEDDRCQMPRWGYVVEGMITFRFAEREETFTAGDAYYVDPGHTPIHYAGAEIVEFSPTEQLGEVIATVMQNAATGAAS